MIHCPNCKKKHTIVHAVRNRCSCGQGFDGKGNVADCNVPPLIVKNLVKREAINPQRDIVRENVGTALAEAIPSWAIANKEGCGCRDFERKMNAWGIAGCEGEHYDEIIEHLMKQTDNLIPLFRKIPGTGRRMIAKRLLDQAIEKTKKQKK